MAIGGTPGHKNFLVDPSGVAVFIPDDFSLGYEKAVFYTGDTEPQATTAFIKGESDEIAIRPEGNTAQYDITVHDQSGAAMADTGKQFSWSVQGNPAGVSVENGLVTVGPDAQAGYVTILAQEIGGELKADKRLLLTASPVPTSIEVQGNDIVLVKKKTEGRTYSYTAVVKDQLGRTMEQEEVTWRIDELENGGASVDETGAVTIRPEIQNGSFLLTAVSKTNPAIEGSLRLTVTGIGGIQLQGPAEMKDIKRLLADSLSADGSGLSRQYTYSPVFKDSDGNQISGETCTYTIQGKTDYQADGVALSANATGGAVITVAPDAVTQTLILTATADNNDDVVENYELNIIKSLVENSGFRKGVGEGSGWTVVDGQVTPSTSGGLALMRMNAADGAEAIANSDPFPVTAGQTYAFGFRSKVGDGMNLNSSMYAMLLFCNSNGDPIEFADVYDENIKSKQDPEQAGTAINGHQTAMEYYGEATAPEGAVSAYVMLGVTGPVKNADFYDIGVYAVEGKPVEPSVFVKSLTVPDQITPGGSIEAEGVVGNTTEQDSEAILIAAVYDENGALKAVRTSEQTAVPAGRDTQLSVSIDIDAGAETAGWTAKAFLWSSMSSMRPIGMLTE